MVLHVSNLALTDTRTISRCPRRKQQGGRGGLVGGARGEGGERRLAAYPDQILQCALNARRGTSLVGEEGGRGERCVHLLQVYIASCKYTPDSKCILFHISQNN